MGALSILSGVLALLPIICSLAVLIGLDVGRGPSSPPLFSPEQPKGPDGKPLGNGIKHKSYCDETIGISPPAVGDHYTLNPNPWNWKEGDDGSLCLNVTTFNNQTYPTDSSAPEFSVTWQYPPGPPSSPVYAYPNIKVDSGVFPNQIKKIDEMMLDFEWTYGVGNLTVETTDKKALNASNVNANVALDLFLDQDKKKAQISEDASIEIMVWFAAFGPATQPIGQSDGSLDEQELDGTKFKLYSGRNGADQFVLTWYAENPASKFHGDLMPLVDRLVEMGDTNFPTKSDYIGYMAVGTETYFSDDYVTFHVPQLAIDVHLKG
ncbi:concanavalin A-like lectin/glucanase domain-containing protein [Emericellopsis atlantica]|uniref:Concanavalin A-like lectin/glucanase domain-containing protein n=1 Tax=Emericellopsis atlantica TaxID=2614577 RepID=A0A9P7ZNX4_9HYPO|nr:concanavalin A-like lectin/glucanase domain-containing protein [Emericellopsis atlantica]KAG9255594.1 concanavalin A-like lectin/glucanase domain-containing protein [Emericellopsis atlantica]